MNDRRLQRKLELETRLPAEEEAGNGAVGFRPMRSGLVTASLLVTMLLAVGLVWRAHQRAQFHQLTAPPLPLPDDTPLPGGQTAVTVNRTPLLQAGPEFVQATLLPGVGMQVLQLAVAVPDHGTQTLLSAPTVAEVAQNTLSRPDAGPFHLALSGPVQAGLPGLEAVADVGATQVTNETEADGGEVTGTFAVRNDLGKPSGFEAKIDAGLTGRSFDVDVRLHNGALASRAFSFDWSPRFAAPGGRLSGFRLSMPSTEQWTGGAVRSVRGTAMDFSPERGTALPETDLDATYVHLQGQNIGDGPEVRLTDLRTGLVLRLVLLSPSIRSVRVRTDAATQTLTLSFGTDDGVRRTTLEAGESAEWHVRVDALPVTDGKAAASAF